MKMGKYPDKRLGENPAYTSKLPWHLQGKWGAAVDEKNA
jgi:hypothetical protein